MSRLTASLIVFIGAAGYGVLATFVKIGYSLGFHVGEMTGSQMFVGAMALWIIALFRMRSWSRPKWHEILLLLAIGAFTGLTGVFYYISLNELPVSIAVILLFQFTWIGVLYEWLFDKRRPTKTTYLSLVLVMIGTILAADLFGGNVTTFSWFGIGMGLCAAFTYAAFIYGSGKAASITPWLRSPLMITGAMLMIFIIFPPSFLVSGVLWEGLWALALVMAFFGAVLPTVCFTIGVPHTGSGIATILSSVELPVAVVMAWVVLSEAVTLYQWLGITLILVAIIAGEWHRLRRPLPEKDI